MRPFLSMIAAGFVVFSLAACETTDTAKVEVSQPVSEAKLKQVYDDMMANTEDGSVQVFPLEPTSTFPMGDQESGYHDALTPIDHTAIPYPVLPKPAAAGKFYSGDSNVTLFPLESPEPSYPKGAIPPMVSPLSHLQAVPPADGVERIYFDHGATGLSSTGRQVTDAVFDRCRLSMCALVKVEGHASVRAEAKDEIQRRLINLKVSMDRAMNVSRQLINSGVPADAIQVTAHGDRIPPSVINGADPEAAARRVEISTNTVTPYTH